MNHQSKRILLIDDEEVILFGFTKVLQEPGVEIDCAQTVEETETCVATHRYDAAIVDLRLSNSTRLEGFDCVRLLLTRQRDCKILVLTAYGDDELKEQARTAGVDLFFEKPLEPEAIKEELKSFGIYQ